MMLKRWSVENFKSIRGRVDLDFCPLTIFSGANSSGKSTIIQSILLAKQTLIYGPPERPITLNGPILKLGRFDDIRHVNGTDLTIGFGCEFDFDAKPIFGSEHGPSRPVPNYYERLRNEISQIRFETKFDVQNSGELANLQPSLYYSSISFSKINESSKIEYPSDINVHETIATSNYFVTINRVSDENYNEIRSGNSLGYVRPGDEIIYKVADIDDVTKNDIIEEQIDAEIVGSRPSHFLPYETLISYDKQKSLAFQVTEALCTLRLTFRSRRAGIENQKMPMRILEFIIDALAEQSSNLIQKQVELFEQHEEPTEITVSDALTYIDNHLRPGPRQKLSIRGGPARYFRSLPQRQAQEIIQEHQSHIFEELCRHYGSERTIRATRVSSSTDAMHVIHEIFENGTSYLGPLRDEPKPLYPLEALAKPTDVGYRGEHTAAVLELNRNRIVRYISPSTIQESLIAPYLKSATLHDAAVEWLSYLGVAEDVITSDRGKFGHELQVTTVGLDKNHDLTNVGVGVSQVLPIVIMALLSRHNSLLIFEQPELHLHPKVQSRLADFFLSLSLQGKQCIVETHSEYMIQRIRRRVAEYTDKNLHEYVSLYFVERKAGSSEYRRLNISEYGAIMDWPEDFFDQSDSEISKILEAAARKRVSKKHSRGAS